MISTSSPFTYSVSPCTRSLNCVFPFYLVQTSLSLLMISTLSEMSHLKRVIVKTVFLIIKQYGSIAICWPVVSLQTMLKIIQHKLENGVCDEVMEIAWSTMWNVTGQSTRVGVVRGGSGSLALSDTGKWPKYCVLFTWVKSTWWSYAGVVGVQWKMANILPNCFTQDK